MSRRTLDFLYSLIDYEKVVGYGYNLEAYKNFLDNFNSPHENLNNVILIGGTKGKGSTAAIISSCLQSNGYRVGQYTSPHLKDINERIKLDEQSISDSDFDRHLQEIMPVITKKRGARSFFEALTTVAFLYFLEKQVDFTVLEVGLGGRLDATNAANPLLSVITRIGYDHTNLLGKRLDQITREKAGIIREGGTLITLHQKPTVEKLLSKITKEKRSKIIFAQDRHAVEILTQSLKGIELSVDGELGNFDLFLPLAGTHQIENTAIALAVLSELQKLGFRLGTDSIRQGIKNTRLHGRFDVISTNPLIIFDCAHNEDSFRALEQNLHRFRVRDFYLVFGSNRDKDIRYCLKNIFPKAKEVFLVKADNPRALDPAEIFTRAAKYQKNITKGNSVRQIIDLLKKRKEKPLTIVVAGSFYLWQKNWVL
ncbi:MAG: bifunctional folylpolyglutamate synthase/dihydrofolate synthase [candidate division WOR-3 bacterium]|nr:MAG: bifunctional folylpolyglutamate synthase/dihydrofolate synthase [candidate division WOR-3 bacterium]